MKNNPLNKTVDLLLKKINCSPQIAIITGSGIKLFPKIKPSFSIKFDNLPIYKNLRTKSKKTVKGHKGEISLYEVNGKNVLIFAGRKHLYEGLTINNVTKNVQLIHKLGIKNLLITNAAGGLSTKYNAGDLMLITGFIDLMQSTERGVLSGIIEKPAKVKTKLNNTIKKLKIKDGNYAGMHGPNYETYSEIKLLQKLNANAVGMSTIPELLASKSYSLNHAAISVISNIWDKKHKPTHTEVLRNVEKANKKLNKLVLEILPTL